MITAFLSTIFMYKLTFSKFYKYSQKNTLLSEQIRLLSCKLALLDKVCRLYVVSYTEKLTSLSKILIPVYMLVRDRLHLLLAILNQLTNVNIDFIYNNFSNSAVILKVLFDNLTLSLLC